MSRFQINIPQPVTLKQNNGAHPRIQMNQKPLLSPPSLLHPSLLPLVVLLNSVRSSRIARNPPLRWVSPQGERLHVCFYTQSCCFVKALLLPHSWGPLSAMTSYSIPPLQQVRLGFPRWVDGARARVCVCLISLLSAQLLQEINYSN